jgi:hypothetical protein
MPTFDVGARNSVRIQPVDNEGLVLASDANSWRGDASLVRVISRGLLVSASPVNGRVLRLRKFVIINQYQKWRN